MTWRSSVTRAADADACGLLEAPTPSGPGRHCRRSCTKARRGQRPAGPGRARRAPPRCRHSPREVPPPTAVPRLRSSSHSLMVVPDSSGARETPGEGLRAFSTEWPPATGSGSRYHTCEILNKGGSPLVPAGWRVYWRGFPLVRVATPCEVGRRRSRGRSPGRRARRPRPSPRRTPRSCPDGTPG